MIEKVNCLEIKDIKGKHIIDLDNWKKLDSIKGCSNNTKIDLNNNKLIGCSLSGSHAYGFDTKKSDYDVRCIHQAHTKQFLGIKKPVNKSEVHGSAGEKEVDFVSYEIGHAMKLVIANNNNLLENILDKNSINFDEKTTEKMKKLSKMSISKKVFSPYMGFYDNIRKDLKERITNKRLLYSYRPLMSGIYALKTGNIENNIPKLNKEFKIKNVDLLIENIIHNKEIDDIDLSEIYKEFDELESRLINEKEISTLPDEPQKQIIDDINDFLVDTRLNILE